MIYIVAAQTKSVSKGSVGVTPCVTAVDKEKFAFAGAQNVS
jgi:hypothetical protein